MGTSAEKHARQKQARSSKLQEATVRARQSSRRRRLVTVIGVLLGVGIIVAGVWILTGSGDDDTAEGSTTTTTAGDSTTTTAADAAELPRPPEGITLTEKTPCPPAAGTEKRVERFAGPPPTCIDPDASYTATFSTTKGDFTATLDSKKAPVSVNNFVVLSRYHFYDGVPFHRIVPGFVIQAGDGDGDPWGNNDLGYSIHDELPASSAEYVDYSLAMANSGPNTNGSQFFVVLPGGGAQLQPNYSWFGQVTQGQDVVAAIGALGNAEQKPTEAVVINSVRIDETE
ncbi:MAG TPA: peptidylprolyl isomerase [Microthrixaceae bacterium]|nr:peptidylprolyl isomerase [Microthrixaceae bacterium]HMX06329.1 peptidylprolyl isomerase [Microthrixaceae bacterium]HNB93586.1 peptidylprolyl isomerase [Microthrixaceae bacterium]HNG22343.1 peptidylprolyl isomerase [Microthrixaceae bacterium]HNH36910.1 peptidylprolyl isomerase [Microthrixaceae bacterium]